MLCFKLEFERVLLAAKPFDAHQSAAKEQATNTRGLWKATSAALVERRETKMPMFSFVAQLPFGGSETCAPDQGSASRGVRQG
jgi:hypothetical protein